MDPLLLISIHNTIPTQRVSSLHRLYIHVLKTLILLPDMVCHHVETLTVLLKLSLAKIHNYYELHFLLYLQEDLPMMLRYNRDLSNEAWLEKSLSLLSLGYCLFYLQKVDRPSLVLLSYLDL